MPTISLDHAAHIFFSAFGLLPYDATMCDARDATVAAAGTLFPGSVAHQAAILLAWQAVGLGAAACESSADFSISLADSTIELAPDGSGQLQLGLARGTEHGPVAYTVTAVAPATIDPPNPAANAADNSDGTQIAITADNGATDGAYPIVVTATGSGVPHYAAATLVIDAQAPAAGVVSVRFKSTTTVLTDGTIPLSVAWGATDAGSGVASAELDHSPNGSDWSAIYGPGAPDSPTQFNTTAGPHQFQVVAADAVGNSLTSGALLSSLAEYQENAAQIVYKGGWSTFNSATPWGTTRFSKTRGASATLAFNGTDVVWIAQRGPKRGVARVFVDGVRTIVDLYATSLTERRVVFVAANLAAGQHTIKIVVRGTYGRPRVDLDGFFVLSQ